MADDDQTAKMSAPDGTPDPGELLARALNTPGPSLGSGRRVPPTPEELAALLPQYRIESLLGHGGMGAVYKGVQVALHTPSHPDSDPRPGRVRREWSGSNFLAGGASTSQVSVTPQMKDSGRVKKWAGLLFAVLMTSCNEAEKREWGTLQEVEASLRGAQLAAPRVLSKRGEQILVVPSKDSRSSGIVCIHLNPRARPYYKQLPAAANFVVEASFVDELEGAGKYDGTVIAWLRSHTRP